jgi:autophagy-related protein 5
MLKDSHKQLWNGVLHDNFEQFWSVNRKLMDVAEGECFRSIPVRVYQNNQPFVQRLFEPVTETGKKKTLADLLQFLFGDKSTDCKILIFIFKY